MVIYEDLEGGRVRAYSDRGVYIHGGIPESDYAEAVDPAVMGRVYTETEIPIETEDEPTVEEKAEAFDILVGGAE